MTGFTVFTTSYALTSLTSIYVPIYVVFYIHHTRVEKNLRAPTPDFLKSYDCIYYIGVMTIYNEVVYPGDIRVLKNFASKEDCDYFTDFLNKSLRKNYPLRTTPLNKKKYIEDPNYRHQKFIDDSLKIIIPYCKDVYNFKGPLVREKCEFGIWSPNTSMPPHIDDDYSDSNNTDKEEYNYIKFTALLYLNDDYQGGEIEFIDLNLKIKPEQGDLLIFKCDSLDTTHQVNTVIGSTRCTLSLWLQSDHLES